MNPTTYYNFNKISEGTGSCQKGANENLPRDKWTREPNMPAPSDVNKDGIIVKYTNVLGQVPQGGMLTFFDNACISESDRFKNAFDPEANDLLNFSGDFLTGEKPLNSIVKNSEKSTFTWSNQMDDTSD